MTYSPQPAFHKLPAKCYASQLDLTNIPKHIAIVMDGNRRWAKLRNRPSKFGHWKGSNVVDSIVETALELGVESITLYTFSTENWKRSKIEVDALMSILELNLYKMRKKMIQNGVRFETIGDLNPFPDSVKKAIETTKRVTDQDNCQINLILALNYGSRDEVRRAAIKAYQQLQDNNQSIESLTEEMLASHLDTADYGDPELIIRTGGDQRMSNFLLWQASYAEIYSTPILWPDFTKNHLIASISEYQNRQRRLGE
ncbi:MAG: polyprenyl diphosphate synthase [Rhabdochlamydiaceae bacterium]|nr:polyprenyl diphosphate synthase [Candidatus Amphrikana amoebophyrae]